MVAQGEGTPNPLDVRPDTGEPPSSSLANETNLEGETSTSAPATTTSTTGTSTTPTSPSNFQCGGGVGTSPSDPAGNNGCISTGAVAGAAVGAAVGAAILTFLITFMFLRKKNERSGRHGKRRSGSGGFSTYTEKALPKDPSAGGEAILAASAWQKHLPQSADDKTIRASVKTLFDQVEVHVENFYQDSTVPMTEALQAELLRVDSPHLPESIVALLPRARSQTALIKHCLLSYIVASISTDDNSVQSLLPADYATLPHLALAAGQKKPGTYKKLSSFSPPLPAANTPNSFRPSPLPMASPKRLPPPLPQE